MLEYKFSRRANNQMNKLKKHLGYVALETTIDDQIYNEEKYIVERDREEIVYLEEVDATVRFSMEDNDIVLIYDIMRGNKVEKMTDKLLSGEEPKGCNDFDEEDF